MGQSVWDTLKQNVEYFLQINFLQANFLQINFSVIIFSNNLMVTVDR